MRKITSIILALAFIIIAVTGVQMNLLHGERGKPPVVQSNDNGNNIVASTPRVPQQASFYPKVAHEWAGYLFIIAGLTHLMLNLKPMQSYLRIRR